jgi:transcriptional regulator with XRE-family HTH domain
MPGGALYVFKEEIHHLARADFIWRVVELMQTKGISIDQLADLSRVDRVHLSEILSGTISPTHLSVTKITDALEVTPQELGAYLAAGTAV